MVQWDTGEGVPSGVWGDGSWGGVGVGAVVVAVPGLCGMAAAVFVGGVPGASAVVLGGASGGGSDVAAADGWGEAGGAKHGGGDVVICAGPGGERWGGGGLPAGGGNDVHDDVIGLCGVVTALQWTGGYLCWESGGQPDAAGAGGDDRVLCQYAGDPKRSGR